MVLSPPSKDPDVPNARLAMAPTSHIRDGYLRDFVSGQEVRATSEEKAVQIISRRLVDDFGYRRDLIQTRPQYRVRRRPSDSGRSFPVDIAVFSSPSRDESSLEMVAECKRKNRREGTRQLEIYLTMSNASIGIWFNGQEHLYLRKQYVEGGQIVFEELPAIPRFGQRVEDIGLYRRGDLRPTHALKPVFRDIRNHLAGSLTGITRDEALAQQIINVLFCKIFDEIDKGPEEYVDFRAGVAEPTRFVHKRILDLFSAVKDRFGDVFSPVDTIEIDPDNITYVVGELQHVAVSEVDRDAIGDAFEVFIGPALRGLEGQFFTPRNVIQMMIRILDPQPDEMIIDPACGSGGFLIVALEHVWSQIEAVACKKHWSETRIAEERRYVASKFFRGIEKDRFLAKVTKAYMAVVGDGRGGVFCSNSLQGPQQWDPLLSSAVKLGAFDVVVTNPPFGTKIKVTGTELLSQYDLGHKFARNKETNRYERTSTLYSSRPPQIIFIERCLQLLKPGGRLGIVLPESLLGMPTYTYLVQYLRKRCAHPRRSLNA